MKKFFLSIFTLSLLFTSCDVETIDVAFTEDHQIDTPSDTVFSVLGILAHVQRVADQTVILGEVRGDLVQLRPDITDEDLTVLGNFETDSPNKYNPYRELYAIVNNCNYYLHEAPDDMYREGENIFARERAAVSAIRCWSYLQLAMIFERVPYYTTPLLSFSDIEKVSGDTSNRKSIDELCDLLIPELESHLNVGYPTYGNFTYGQDYTVNSRKFFFPIPLLLADMHLWRASIRGQEEDYIKAAQYYHDYLVEEQYSVWPQHTNSYTDTEFITTTLSWNQLYTGDRNWDTERISIIPMATHANYGQTSNLQQVMGKLQGSESLKELAGNQFYCHVGITDEVDEDPDLIPSRYQLLIDDSIYGTKAHPELLHYIHVAGEPSYARGDLRIYKPQEQESEYTISIDKFPARYPHISTYRSNHIYLRLAEAICRAGYPETAFCMLKYGLSRGNMLMYNQKELPQLLLSGHTFYDFGNNKNQIGIHARGCGNIEMDTIFYQLPLELSADEKIEYVEDLICDELALDCSFEGLRYFDLMRFAHRRGTDYLASRIARRVTPQTPDESLRLKLQDKANWYLKPVSE